VSVQPLIVVVKDFATQQECSELLKLIERCHGKDWSDCHEIRSRLHRKGNDTVGEKKRPWRNSTSFTLELNGELDGAVDALVRRSHLLARHPITYGEGVQVASYREGDYYEFHHDSLMRRATVLLYLTDVPEGDGGETIFPLVRAANIPDDVSAPLPPAVIATPKEKMDFKVHRMEEMAPYCDSNFYLKIRPQAGTAIMFFSYRPDYSQDSYAIHGACPLKRGHKAIFQRWMRFEENSLIEKASQAVREARTLWGHQRLLQPGNLSAPTTTKPEAKAMRGLPTREAGDGQKMLRSIYGEMPPEL